MSKIIFEKEIKNIIQKISKKKNINIKNLPDYLDSLQMLDLISSLEEKFNIKINDKYITEKNFENYSKIKKLIEKIINEKK